MFNINKIIFKSGRKKFMSLINKYNINFNDDKQYYSILDYIKRYLPHIDFNEIENKFCILITKRIQFIDILKNKQPNSAAIGIIFFVIKYFNKQITKSYLAKISSKSEPTISKIFYILTENKKYIIPLKFNEN